METLKLFISIVFFFIVQIIVAQQNVTIDLSQNVNQVRTQNVSPEQVLNISVVNKLPKGIYEISVEKKYQLPEVLTFEKDSLAIESIGGGVQMCAAFLEKINDFLTTEKESDIPLAKEILSKELTILREELSTKDTTTEGCMSYHLMKGEQVLAMTEEQLLPQKIAKGQSLEVTVKRKKENDKYDIWKFVYVTEKKGKWLTTYGFTYITQIFQKSEPFFSKQKDSVFEVAPLDKRSKLSFVPSIFFTWFPYKDLSNNFSHSITGGLGYDLEAPTAFLGYSLLFNQNIGFSIGLSAHQQEFLHGKYNEGDILNENLEGDQLNEKLYTLNPYFSLSFRFGTSPFTANNEND
nr:hypothetical protein [uncultured Allomuricauda sp.]